MSLFVCENCRCIENTACADIGAGTDPSYPNMHMMEMQGYGDEVNLGTHLTKETLRNFPNGIKPPTDILMLCSECNTGQFHNEFDKTYATVDEHKIASYSRYNAITPYDHKPMDVLFKDDTKPHGYGYNPYFELPSDTGVISFNSDNIPPVNEEFTIGLVEEKIQAYKDENPNWLNTLDVFGLDADGLFDTPELADEMKLSMNILFKRIMANRPTLDMSAVAIEHHDAGGNMVGHHSSGTHIVRGEQAQYEPEQMLQALRGLGTDFDSCGGEAIRYDTTGFMDDIPETSEYFSATNQLNTGRGRAANMMLASLIAMTGSTDCPVLPNPFDGLKSSLRNEPPTQSEEDKRRMLERADLKRQIKQLKRKKGDKALLHDLETKYKELR